MQEYFCPDSGGFVFVVEEDEVPSPLDVGFIGAEGVVSVAKGFAILVEEFFTLRAWYSLRGWVLCCGHVLSRRVLIFVVGRPIIVLKWWSVFVR